MGREHALQACKYVTPHELVASLVETVACGGNMLINIGPTKEGTIVPVQQERLLQLGAWLEVNGEAIYNSVPWTVQKDALTPRVWYTSRPSQNKVYAIALNWPVTNTLRLGLGSVISSTVSNIHVLGWPGTHKWIEIKPQGIEIKMPPLEISRSQWAWTIVINTA